MAKFKDYDDYINQAQDFAKPLLMFFRECVIEACPDVKEEFKWSSPSFTYNGSILCDMAGLKQHIIFGFWLGAKMKDSKGILIPVGNTGMARLGKISSTEDLPDRETLISYIKEAMQLTDAGVKSTSKSGPKKKAKALEVPQILVDALNQNNATFQTFNDFSQSKRNDYSQWISEAKTKKTQLKRLDQAIEWLEEGKSRNWKYEKH